MFSLFVERNGSIPNVILSLVIVPGDEDAEQLDVAMAASHLLLKHESNVNNQKLMGKFGHRGEY